LLQAERKRDRQRQKEKVKHEEQEGERADNKNHGQRRVAQLVFDNHPYFC
jgi:hypothetical protein